MDSRFRETEKGYMVYGFGYIVDICRSFEGSVIACWSVEERDAVEGLFQCFQVDSDPIRVHIESI